MLLSLYLFAIFRGAAADPQLAPEHPLTSSSQYMALYAMVPFLGAITGVLSGWGLEGRAELAYRAALGTFVATFAAWVILDPTIAALEAMLPTSRSYRAQRVARERAIREERERQRQQLLAHVLEQQQASRRIWQEQIPNWVSELSGLTKDLGPEGFERARQRAIQIGAKAWQMGGLACMQELYQTITNQDAGPLAEYIEHWWDGIGAWRGPNA